MAASQTGYALIILVVGVDFLYVVRLLSFCIYFQPFNKFLGLDFPKVARLRDNRLQKVAPYNFNHKGTSFFNLHHFTPPRVFLGRSVNIGKSEIFLLSV